VRRGEVWWAKLPAPVNDRPVVLVSREEAYRARSHVLVVPVTTRVRGLPTEVVLDRRNGLPHPSVANCDTIQLAAKTRLERRVGQLDAEQTEHLGHALRFALGLDA
jgi:mRNA-degrading endonuclease toxin of MazEF toxin-antitoxin module